MPWHCFHVEACTKKPFVAATKNDIGKRQAKKILESAFLAHWKWELFVQFCVNLCNSFLWSQFI
jgi:hypothetical protein